MSKRRTKREVATEIAKIMTATKNPGEDSIMFYMMGISDKKSMRILASALYEISKHKNDTQTLKSIILIFDSFLNGFGEEY